jgi:hypothetical protein
VIPLYAGRDGGGGGMFPICLSPYIYIYLYLLHPPPEWRAVQEGLLYPGGHLVKHTKDCRT